MRWELMRRQELAAGHCRQQSIRLAQLAPPAGWATVATLENVLLALEPRVVMAAMHTTMIRANITAYSTAVGPSSFFKNLTRLRVRDRIFGSGVKSVGGFAMSVARTRPEKPLRP